jgi:hypothetical protein
MRASAFVMLALLLVAPARAEPRLSSTEKAARAHLGLADRAFKNGAYDDALAQLQAAYATDPRPEYLIVFAQVYRAMGDAQRAINACELYLATAPQGPRASEARGLMSAARAELDEKSAATPPPPPPPPPVALALEHPPAPAPAPAPKKSRRHNVAVWLGVSAAVVTVAGVALGVGLGLGLRRGPQTISFDPR